MSENTANKIYSEQHKKWIADENSYGPDLVKCTEEEKKKYYYAGWIARREYFEKGDYKTHAMITERVLYLLNSETTGVKGFLDSFHISDIISDDEILKRISATMAWDLMNDASLLKLTMYKEKSGKLVFDGYPGRVMEEIPDAYSLKKKYSVGVKILLFILAVFFMVAAAGLLMMPEIAIALAGEEGFNALGVSLMAVMIFSCKKFEGVIIPAIITGVCVVPVSIVVTYIPLEWLQLYSSCIVLIIASILLFVFWCKYRIRLAEQKKRHERAKLAITYGRTIVENILNAYPEITDLNKIIFCETTENDKAVNNDEDNDEENHKRILEYLRLYCKAISNKVNDAEEELKK